MADDAFNLDALNMQVTDDNGQPAAGETVTPPEEPIKPEEKTPEEEPTPAEKPHPPQEDEEQPVEDETGKRYVPEERFKKVYGKAKEAERELERLKQQIQSQQPAAKPGKQPTVDKTEVLEVELLKGKLPQFDPESDQYSPELDELGATIFGANPGISRMEAARRAIKMVEKLATKTNEIKQEARTIKSLQSDQGITTRVISRESSSPDPDKMTEKEKEDWLKANGQW